MRHLHLTLVTALCHMAVTIAQPNITSGNMPIVGDNVTIAICSDVPNAATLDAETGADHDWDFSFLTEQEEQSFSHVDPADTDWGYLYTGSNLCGVSWDGGHSYYHIAADGLYTEGNALVVPPDDTFKLYYTNMEKIVPVPFTFGTTSSDVFSGWSSVSGLDLNVDGTINFEADGYGILTLPNGTYQNVVRYRFEREQVSTFNGFPSGTVTKTQWGWMSADHRFWLLLMEIVNDGISESPLVWYDKSPQGAITGIEAPVSDQRMTVWPNPAVSGSTVQLSDAAIGPNTVIALLDMAGRIVVTFPADGRTALSLVGVPAGMYLLRAVDAEGAVRADRLVVR